MLKKEKRCLFHLRLTIRCTRTISNIYPEMRVRVYDLNRHRAL